jgi:hypothetical protein
VNFRFSLEGPPDRFLNLIPCAHANLSTTNSKKSQEKLQQTATVPRRLRSWDNCVLAEDNVCDYREKRWRNKEKKMRFLESLFSIFLFQRRIFQNSITSRCDEKKIRMNCPNPKSFRKKPTQSTVTDVSSVQLFSYHCTWEGLWKVYSSTLRFCFCQCLTGSKRRKLHHTGWPLQNTPKFTVL